MLSITEKWICDRVGLDHSQLGRKPSGRNASIVNSILFSFFLFFSFILCKQRLTTFFYLNTNSHSQIGNVRSLALPGTPNEKISHLGISLLNCTRLVQLDLSNNALTSLAVSQVLNWGRERHHGLTSQRIHVIGPRSSHIPRKASSILQCNRWWKGPLMPSMICIFLWTIYSHTDVFRKPIFVQSLSLSFFLSFSLSQIQGIIQTPSQRATERARSSLKSRVPDWYALQIAASPHATIIKTPRWCWCPRFRERYATKAELRYNTFENRRQ